MVLRYAFSSLLAAMIAFPMYYMFYAIFSHGLETSPFVTALVIAVITFVITFVIAYVIGRSKHKQGSTLAS